MKNKKIINKNNIYLSRILYLCLIVMGLIFLSKPVYATTSGDWTYYVNSEGTVDLTKYNGTDETVTVPSEIDGYSVRQLYDTFYYNTTVKSVTVSEGITSLSYTFNLCSNLETVILPESLESIHNNTFRSCSSLKELNLGKNVSYVDESAFSSVSLDLFSVDPENTNFCSDGVLLFDKEKTKVIAAPIRDLREYSIPITVKEIGDYGLAYTELGSDTLPDSIEAIGNSGLYGAGPEDASLVLPASLKNVGNYAFGESKFKSIKFGVNVEEIGSEIFQGSHQYLKEIIIDEDNLNFSTDGIAIYSKDKSVLYTALKSGIDSYTISDGVKTIKNNAFYNSDFKEVIIPDGVETIEERAFSNMFYLTSISFPDSVTSIGEYVLYYCSDLTEVKLSKNITEIPNLFMEYCSSVESIEIPSGVTKIGQYAFYSCTSLTDVTIPYGVTTIDIYAFYYCTSLTDVTIPYGVTTIGSYAFGSCTSLTDVTIPSTLTTINNYAFNYCTNLKTVTIPESVTSISDYAFNACSDSLVFNVKEGSYADSYAQAKGFTCNYITEEECEHTWSDGEVTTEPTTSSTGIMTYTCIKCGETKTEDIPMLEEEDDTSDFTFTELADGTYQLKSYTGTDAVVVVPETYNGKAVTSIYSDAFEYNKSITSVTLPSTVTSIGSYAFYYCSNLESINIPESVKTISSYAFSYCTSLESITIPESVESISSGVFTGCSDSLVLYVAEGSYAETYADTNKLSYQYITEEECIHTWNDGVVTTEPTTSSTGVRTYTCTKCGATKTEIIPVLEEDDDTSNFTFSLLSDGTYQVYSYTGTAASVVVPQTYNGYTVTAIGPEAFNNNDNIKVIKISNNIKTIDSSAFYGCNNLEAINVDSNNLYFVSIAGVLYNEDITALYTCPPKAVGINYEIPYGVVTIKECAFRNCSTLQTVTIPNTVNVIEYRAFENCQALETVRVPKQVTTINSYVFDGCEELTLEVYEGSTAESYADTNDIPYAYVNEYTYGDYKYEIKGDNTIVITGYTGYENEVVIPETIYGTKVTEIGDRVFAENNFVNRITVGENITSVGNEAFADCTNLQDVVFKGDNVLFGDFVFDGSDNVEVIANRGSDAWEYASDSGVYPHECTHDWGEGVVTIPASVTSEGESTYTCSICGATKTEAIPRLINTHSHSWDDGVVTTPATTTSEGVKTYTCQICGETRTETIAKLAAHTVHTWNGGVVTKPATVKTTGIKTYTCTVCGTTKTETIPKLTCSHTWNGGEVTTEATVLNEGTIVYTCTRCGETNTETIPKQDIKIGSQAKVDGMVCIITSTDKRTVKCTGLYNNNMSEVNLGTTQIRINNDVYVIDSIGDYAFSGCSAGVKINLSNNKKLKSVGKGAFGSVPAQNIVYPSSAKLKAQYQKLFSGSKKSHTEISGKGIYRVLDEKKKTAAFIGGTDSSAKKVSIPSTVNISGNKYKVTVVGEKALYNYKKLNKLYFGKNIEKVEENAITGCVRLSYFDISSKKMKVFKKSNLHKLNRKSPKTKAYPSVQAKYEKMFKKYLKYK